MFKRRALPPHTRFTLRDGLEIMLGLIMIPLGLMILYNTVTRGAVLPGLLIGGAFVAFGVYRLTFAWGRLRWYREIRGRKQA